jgi:hypothetical protein
MKNSNFNELEVLAIRFFEINEYDKSLDIYLFMADGDSSLDGGYLAEMIGRCYEAKNDFMAAKYWYGRAIEENPVVRVYSIEARKRLNTVGVTDLLENYDKLANPQSG